MNHPEVVLLVRFKTSLSLEEIAKVAEERAPEFKALEGLQQKYYLQDVASGEYAGLYLWKSPEALAEYRDSELRASIAAAYQVQGEPQVEVYKVVKTLRDDIA
jgi:heme-degrading monooxygenase HmoA